MELDFEILTKVLGLVLMVTGIIIGVLTFKLSNGRWPWQKSLERRQEEWSKKADQVRKYIGLQSWEPAVSLQRFNELAAGQRSIGDQVIKFNERMATFDSRQIRDLNRIEKLESQQKRILALLEEILKDQ